MGYILQRQTTDKRNVLIWNFFRSFTSSVENSETAENRTKGRKGSKNSIKHKKTIGQNTEKLSEYEKIIGQNMESIKDIPQSMIDSLRREFENDSNIIQLRIAQNSLQRRGKYREAMEAGKQIEVLFTKVLYGYLEESRQQAGRINLDKLGASREDLEEIDTGVMVLFMASDIIDSAIMDVNSKVKKYNRELSFDMFNDVRELAKAVKEKLKYLSTNTDYMSNYTWGERCDDMYDIIRSKARSILRKKSPVCGKKD